MKPIMQNTKLSLVLALVLFFAGTIIEGHSQDANISFQFFYDELSPYGTWLEHPDYGDVWSPNVENNFVPYATNGYWTVTQYGNTWVSNYDWGWGPFHYGRWFNDNYYGWVWIPGSEWAPAWVAWRNGGRYYGWAPLSPGLHFSLSINLFDGIPNHYWTFVPYQYVWHQSVYNYCAPRNRNIYMIHNTTYVTHHHNHHNEHHRYFTGPSHDEIRRATNRPVREHYMEDRVRPGRSFSDNDRLSMYRPSVSRNDSDRPRQSKGYDPRGNHSNGNDRSDDDGQNVNGNKGDGQDSNGDHGNNGNRGNGNRNDFGNANKDGNRVGFGNENGEANRSRNGNESGIRSRNENWNQNGNTRGYIANEENGNGTHSTNRANAVNGEANTSRNWSRSNERSTVNRDLGSSRSKGISGNSTGNSTMTNGSQRRSIPNNPSTFGNNRSRSFAPAIPNNSNSSTGSSGIAPQRSRSWNGGASPSVPGRSGGGKNSGGRRK
jgi:hypothetical protein